MLSILSIPGSTVRTKSSVVFRIPRRTGHRYFYAHGGITMPVNAVPTPGNGGVPSSAYQPILVQLHDWMVNAAWYAAGYPRNLGYSFRVHQLNTQVTGGSGPGRMQVKPVYPGVQTVRRYSVRPRVYPTKAASS